MFKRIVLLNVVVAVLFLTACSTKKPVRSSSENNKNEQLIEPVAEREMSPADKKVQEYKSKHLLNTLHLKEDQIEPFFEVTRKYEPQIEKAREGKGSNAQVLKNMQEIKDLMIKELEGFLTPVQIDLFKKHGY